MADRLSLANALAEAKIERAAAERIATEIVEAIHNSVATKSDLERLEAKFERLEARVEADLEKLDAKLDATAAAFRGDLQRLDTKLDASVMALRGEMVLLEHRLLLRLGSLIVVLFGLLFAALRYLPPPH